MLVLNIGDRVIHQDATYGAGEYTKEAHYLTQRHKDLHIDFDGRWLQPVSMEYLSREVG